MGNAPSTKNVADANLTAIASVVNDAVQNCAQEISQDIAQYAQFNNDKIQGSINISAENSLVLKEGCLQSEQASTQLDTALQATAAQTAQTIAQQFSLDSAKAKNIIDINAKIASEIKNNFVQVCANQVSQDIRQSVNLSETEVAGSITLNAKNYQEAMVKCSATGTSINNLKQQLELQINQSAIAKVESFFLPFFIALMVIIGVIALFLFLPSFFKKSTSSSGGGSNNGNKNIEELADLGENLRKTGGAKNPGGGTGASVLKDVGEDL